MNSPLRYLTPDYVNLSLGALTLPRLPTVTFVTTGTSSSNAAGYGSGANAKQRSGSSVAQAGFAGRQGVVYIVWYG